MSLEETYNLHKLPLRMPHWAALRDSDEHLPFVG